MLLPVQLFATAAAAVLTTATIYNSAETLMVCEKKSNFGKDSSILCQYTVGDAISVPVGKNKNDIINDLKSMRRRDLLEIFKRCEVPDHLSVIEGEWDGLLLNNNYVLTSVSTFITNALFGKSKPWNGKQFGYIKDKSTGINRFRGNEEVINKVHQFDYSIEPSFFGKSSILLNYSKHQGLLSLWKTMVDEVRVLKVPKADKSVDAEDKFDFILLGVGSMAWSGGMYNCQPFCLYHTSTTSNSS